MSEPYSVAAAEGRLVVQRCRDCEALRWPPLVGCPECLSRETDWVDVAPRGTVWSYVVYHRAFATKYSDEIPYTVAVVQLDDGPYLVGRLAAEEPLAVGDRVVAVFSSDGEKPDVRWRREKE